VLAGGAHDRPGERVLALRFDRRRLGQDRVTVAAGDAGDDVLAARQRSGLVEEHDVDETAALQAEPVLDEDAVAGSERRGDRDHEWDREPERVRARDHEHAHGADHAEVDVVKSAQTTKAMVAAPTAT
jgi:hypothetical protein